MENPDAPVTPASTAALPDRSRGRTTRHAPPASPGLPSSAKSTDKRDRRRRNHPADRTGPMSLETTAEIMAMAGVGKTPEEIAVVVGADASGISVKGVIAAARQRFARNADKYVDLHLAASAIQAAAGNTDAIQWALKSITEEGTRIVDPEQVGPAMPSLQIGIAVGGVPAPAALPVVKQVPQVDAREEIPVLDPQAVKLAELAP